MTKLKVGNKVEFLIGRGRREVTKGEIIKISNSGSISLCTILAELYDGKLMEFSRFNFELKKLTYNKRRLKAERLPK